MTRSYSELMLFSTFEERFDYLSIRGAVGDITFGHDRWLNQEFYRSTQWKQMRQRIILRDNACDLAAEGYDIHHRIVIHHMNPIHLSQLVSGSSDVLNPDYLICTTHQTHNAIHYGDRSLLPKIFTPRRMGDTKLW